MEETAAFIGPLRIDISGSEFQTVQNLLSGHIHQTQDVSPRINILKCFRCYIAVQRGANAAAVHKGDINIIIPAVKIIIRRVGAEIADCRFLFAYKAFVAVMRIKPYIRMGNHAALFFRHDGYNIILNGFHIGIGRHVRQKHARAFGLKLVAQGRDI